jgi:hypothetical protein
MSVITAAATGTRVLIHTHGADGDSMLVTNPDQDAARWVSALNKVAEPGEWAAVPPAGSDWERADWESLAQRAGVA